MVLGAVCSLKESGQRGLHIGLARSYEDTSHISCEDPGSAKKQTKMVPPLIQNELECEVEGILNHKSLEESHKNKRVIYLLKWSGLPKSEAMWEKAEPYGCSRIKSGGI